MEINRAFRMTIKTLVATAMYFLATSTAHAMLINVDFQRLTGDPVYAGQGILGSGSDTYWNAVDAVGKNNLTLADGTTASGVNVTTTFYGSYGNPSTNALLGDRLYGYDPSTGAGTDSETITLSGLTPGEYKLAFYNGFYAQTYSAAGKSVSINPFSNSAIINYSSWLEGAEYVLLQSVLVGIDGELVITVTPFAGRSGFGQNSAIAGLQIESISSIPLPAAVYLFATGLLGLAGIARRKAQAT